MVGQNRKTTPGIPRVIKQGNHSICGLCGTRYTVQAAAEACLRSCAAKLSGEAVQSSPESRGQSYRCTYCKRVYTDFEEAKNCATACKASMLKRMEAENRAKTAQASEEKLKALAQLANENDWIAPTPKILEAPQTEKSPQEKKGSESTPAGKPPAPARPQATQAPAIPKTPTEAKVSADSKVKQEPSRGSSQGKSASNDELTELSKPGRTPPEKRPSTPPTEPLARKKPETPPIPATPPMADAPKPLHPAEGIKFLRDGDSFRCTQCRQKYTSFQEAMACFDQHKQGTVGQTDPRQEGENTVYTREGSKYRCMSCRKLHFTREDVYACFEGHAIETQDSIEIPIDLQPEISPPKPPAPAAKAAPAPKVEEPEPNVPIKDGNKVRSVAARSETDKYFRDGAKYGCRACKKKYFTKPEVLACFDSHGDDGLLEQTPPPPSPKSTNSPNPAAKETASETAPAKTKTQISNEQLVEALLESALKEIRPTAPSGNKDTEEKFYRNGAKYVCKKCGAKYFTRDDVIACFDAHS